MERMQGIISRSVAIIMIAAMLIVSCSVPQAGPGRVSSSVLVSASGRAIGMYLDDIRQFVDPELPEMDLLDGSDGYDIATRTLEEENGREYLEFALETSRFSSADDVFQAASTLVPEAELEEVKKVVEEAEERLFIAASEASRVLPPAQMEEFYDDLTLLVVKSAVLLTSAIVYAMVPDVVVWGKVTAASAVAIAAGVLSATIMAVVEHYNSDLSLTQSFGEWLETVAKEPAVNWALAASVISISKSLDRGPVVTGIIIAVFTLFGVVEDAKEMLGKYNFSA